MNKFASILSLTIAACSLIGCGVGADEAAAPPTQVNIGQLTVEEAAADGFDAVFEACHTAAPDGGLENNCLTGEVAVCDCADPVNYRRMPCLQNPNISIACEGEE